MKRITKKIRQYDIFATLMDWLYIAIAITVLLLFFQIIEAPMLETEGGTGLTTVIIRDYQFLRWTLTTPQVNRIMSLLVMYLIIFVPNAIINTKRLRSKDIIEIDEWTYRTQFLYMWLALFSGNIISAVLRYKVGMGTKWIYKEYGFKQTMINAYHKFTALFKG